MNLSQTVTATATFPIDVNFRGGSGVFLVAGQGGNNFNSCTFKLQHKVGVTYVDIPDTTLASDGGMLFTTPQAQLRVALASGSSNPNVHIVVNRVD